MPLRLPPPIAYITGNAAKRYSHDSTLLNKHTSATGRICLCVSGRLDDPKLVFSLDDSERPAILTPAGGHSQLRAQGARAERLEGVTRRVSVRRPRQNPDVLAVLGEELPNLNLAL